MTTKPFSSNLNSFILSIIRVRQLAGATDWELANRIWHAIEHIHIYSSEGHDFDAILAQVKNLRAAHQASGTTTTAGTGTSSSSPPPPTGPGSTSRARRNPWSVDPVTVVGGSRGGGPGSGPGGGPSGGPGGPGPGGGSSGPSGPGPSPGSGGPGGGPGGGGSRGGGTRGGGPGGPGGGGPGGPGPGGGGPGSGPGGPGPGGPGSPYPHPHGATADDYWRWQQFIPGQRGFFGKSGAAIGLEFGGAKGQAIGTVIGNFIDKMKDAVIQAREFAVALKESNRRFIYYNADIAMSYVESDFAEMRRNFSIARAIAPNVTSLNQQITTYQQTVMPWDIFRTKMSYETKGAGLGAAQYLAEVASPAVSYLNSVLDRISPSGNTGYQLGQKIMRANLQAAYATIPLIGPILGLLTGAGLLPGLLPAPNANPVGANKGDPIGPWEKLMNNPNAILPRDAQFHQNPNVFRLKKGMRF